MRTFTHCSERDLAPGPVTPGQFIRQGQRCFCFSSSQSKTESDTTDQRVVANEGSVGQSGSSNNQATGSASLTTISQGKDSKVVGTEFSNIVGGVKIETLSPEKLSELLGGLTTVGEEAFAGLAEQNKAALDSLANLSSANTAAAAAASKADKEKVDSLIAEVNQLATDQQSAGYSASQKSLVVVVLSVLALGGFWIYRRAS